MVSQRPDMERPSLDRLNVGRLCKLLSSLGLQVSYWAEGSDQIRGSAPEVPVCQRLCATGRHCQPFLVQLARDTQADPNVRYRSCMPGTFTVTARLDPSSGHSPVVLGCGVTSSLAESEAARQVLASLQIHEPGLLAAHAGACGGRRDDIAWRAAAFTQISQEWYARDCQQVREVEVLSESLAETYEELSFIHRLNEAMNLAASHRAYFQGLAEELRELVAAEVVVIRLYNKGLVGEPSDADTICAGQSNTPVERIAARVDQDRLAKRGYQICAIDAGQADAGDNQAPGEQLLAAPIVRQTEQMGVIIALRTGQQHKFNNIDVTRVSSIAKSAAVILENFRLYDNLRHLFLGTVRALTRSIDAKDRYTCGHSERVATISRRLLLALGGTEQQADRVYLCGMLHDIGKIGIPEEVLHKPGKLTPEQFSMIKQHPTVGAAILDGIGELEDVVPGVLHHHERLDGLGYPKGLKGDDIPLYARVLAVADTFDAMTSERPYRKALSVQVATEELQRHAGTQFDPAVVEALRRLDPEALVQELGAAQHAAGEAVAAEASQPG